MVGVTDEVAHRQPGRKAHPIGSRYAHLVVSEDMMINGLLKGGVPMFTISWAGKTGLKDPQAEFMTTLEWAQTVRVDLKAMNKYAQAVFETTDAYLGTLTEEDLDRVVDLTVQNQGKWSLGASLITYVLSHVRDIMGEVSALKGVYGMPGYPF